MYKTLNKSFLEKKIISSGIIPLIENKDFKILKSLSEITIRCGFEIIEFGIRDKDSINNYCKLSKFLKIHSRDIIIGAGSITNLWQAQEIIKIGTDFIVSPGLDVNIAKICQDENIYYIPGCATVSEILNAKKIGCELIKIFPIHPLGGTKFLRSLKGPLPWLKAIPAGGIEPDPETIKNWLNIGAKAVIIGSKLYSKDFNKKSSFLEIEEILKSLLKINS